MKNDQELVNKIRRGDKDAFSLLVKALILKPLKKQFKIILTQRK
ncbi:hypothetical protein [Peribacillus butanolivorans]|nr:hypothetical protein [Peribacillus butanolivorans]